MCVRRTRRSSTASSPRRRSGTRSARPPARAAIGSSTSSRSTGTRSGGGRRTRWNRPAADARAGPDHVLTEPAPAPPAPGSGAGGWSFSTVAGWCRRANGALALLSAGLIVAIVLLTLYEIVSRYGFHTPTTWTFPLSSYLLLYVIYTSTAYALQEGSHVQVSVIVELLPSRPRRVVG